jgi:hypothetical protein
MARPPDGTSPAWDALVPASRWDALAVAATDALSTTYTAPAPDALAVGYGADALAVGYGADALAVGYGADALAVGYGADALAVGGGRATGDPLAAPAMADGFGESLSAYGDATATGPSDSRRARGSRTPGPGPVRPGPRTEDDRSAASAPTPVRGGAARGRAVDRAARTGQADPVRQPRRAAPTPAPTSRPRSAAARGRTNQPGASPTPGRTRQPGAGPPGAVSPSTSGATGRAGWAGRQATSSPTSGADWAGQQGTGGPDSGADRTRRQATGGSAAAIGPAGAGQVGTGRAGAAARRRGPTWEELGRMGAQGPPDGRRRPAPGEWYGGPPHDVPAPRGQGPVPTPPRWANRTTRPTGTVPWAGGSGWADFVAGTSGGSGKPPSGAAVARALLEAFRRSRRDR